MNQYRISLLNVIQILGIFATILLVYLVKDVLILVFIAWIISIALNPIVDRLEKYGLPRPLTASIILILFLGLVVGIFAVSIPQISSQVRILLESLPDLVNNAVDTLNTQNIIPIDQRSGFQAQITTQLINQVGQLSNNAVEIATVLINAVTTSLVALFLTFYFMVDKFVLRRLLLTIFKNTSYIVEMYERCEQKLRVWLRGQLIAMISIGIVTYIGLTILQVKFALPLALLAGVMEIVPFIGPTVSSVPAIFIGLSESPTRALIIALFYFLVQQLEAIVLIPRIMNKAVGLNPIAVIVAVMIGSRLLGPIGALISIPVVAILIIIIEEWNLHKSNNKSENLV